MTSLVQLTYVVACALFVFSLHWMNDPKTARRGVFAGVAAMALAVLATWIQPAVVHHGWIIVAIIAGFVVGVPLSRVPLTAVPQRTALSHAFGGLAAGLLGAPPLPGRHRPGSAVRRAAHHPDRRRRHADGHRHPQLVRRPLGGSDGL